MGFHYFNLTKATGGALSDIAYTQRTNAFQNVDYGAAGLNNLIVTGSFVDDDPSGGTFTAAASTEIFTLADHGFGLGLVVQVSNSGGALPSGLTDATNYYVIPITSSTFYLATSLENALNSTYLSITTNGTGTNTVTPTALEGATIELQGSNDNGATWQTVSNCSTTVTTDGDVLYQVNVINFASYSLLLSVGSGQLTFSNLQFGYGG